MQTASKRTGDQAPPWQKLFERQIDSILHLHQFVPGTTCTETK